MLLERILDGRIRAVVALRQRMEKKLEGQEDTAIRFIDLEKAYATIPREITMTTMR